MWEAATTTFMMVKKKEDRIALSLLYCFIQIEICISLSLASCVAAARNAIHL